MLCQTKTVETTAEALADDNDTSLPPLMNPTMLEASDDLTNLSHLNEPAGKTLVCYRCLRADLIDMYSFTSYQAAVFTEGNLHVQWHSFDCHESLRTR